MRLIVLSAASAVLLLLTALLPSTAWAAVPSGGILDFTVLRNGDPIGRHVIKFEQADGGLVVKIKTEIAVKLLFVTVFSFDHEGREVWRNGHLVALDSNTDDDGTPHTLAIRAEGNHLAVDGDGEASTAPPEIIPASLWNEGILAGGAILNTLYGEKMNVTVHDAGNEPIAVSGQTISARHYIIEGDLQRELWFDDNQVLVMVRFKGNDDSNIEYVLR